LCEAPKLLVKVTFVDI